MLLGDPDFGPRVTFAEGGDFETFGDTLARLNSYTPGVALSRTAASIARDPAAYGDVVRAAARNQVVVDNSNAKEAAFEAAVDQRIKAVRDATGVTLTNYMRDSKTLIEQMALRSFEPAPLSDEPAETGRDAFHRRLRELAESFPDKRDLIRPDVSVEDDARAVARGAAGALETATAQPQVTGLGGFVAGLAGGFGGSFRDPLQVATLFAGGGITRGATVALRIGQAALREAAINAGAVALLQPAVQSWREEAGLRSGLVPALENVGLGALFGAIPGGAIQGVRELRGPARAAAEKLAAGTATPAETARAVEALGVRLSDHDAAALRAAVAEPKPEAPLKGVPAELDAEITAQAIRHAEAPDLFPPPEIALAVPPRPAAQAHLIDEALPGAAASVDDKPVTFGSFDPRGMIADAATFQFKGGTDAAGLTDRLKGVTEWDPLASGKVFVFERADGSRVIADGHQRLGLAQRLMEENATSAPLPGRDRGSTSALPGNIGLHGYLFREADGWTPADVRALAAKKNMQEGSGDALDVARILRERPDILDGALPVSGPMMRNAVALARLSDEAFGLAVNGVVPPQHAAAVGALVPEPAQHAAVLADLARLAPETEREARIAIGEIMAAGFRAEEQIDLFGAAETTRSLLAERIKTLDAAMAALVRDKKLFGTLAEKADTIEAAGNVLARTGNEARARDAAALQDLLSRLARRTGPVSDALNRAAAQLADGGKPKAAAEAFLDEVRALLDRDGLAGLLAEPRLTPAAVVEPASPEAVQVAEMANAVRQTGPGGAMEPTAREVAPEAPQRLGEASEKTPAGEQSLIPGVAPVTEQNRIAARAAEPLRGGNAPAGGLFDDAARQQLDLVDAIAASPRADGAELRLKTREVALAEGERPGFLADLVKSCRD